MFNTRGIIKAVKFVVSVCAASGLVIAINKANEELSKFGLNVDYTKDGTIDIHTNHGRRVDNDNTIKVYDIKNVIFDANDVTQRTIAELYHTANKTYMTSVKLNCAKNIYDIANKSDDKTKLVAVQALSRIADGTYASEIKNYVTSAITSLAVSD